MEADHSPKPGAGPGSFKLALVQMLVEGGNRAGNLERALKGIETAARRGAQVALLPEALTLGWTHGSAWTEAELVPSGQTCEVLRDAARRHGIYVCAGLVERAAKKIYNTAVLFNDAGELLLHYRKVNELEIAHGMYALGDRLAVCQTPLATFGLMICADAFARGEVVSRTLAMMGAQVILSPCAWAVPASHDQATEPYGQLWRDHYGRVARDFRLWIAGASNVGLITDGPWRGRNCIGCSLVVGPEGRLADIAPYGTAAETILCVDINPQPRPAQGTGWTDYWDSHPSPS